MTYENRTFGIKIQYPTNWDKQENTSKSNYNDMTIDIVTFSSKFTNNSDTVGESVDIKQDDVSDLKPIILAAYANDQLNDLKQDFKVIELDPNATLAGNPAYKIVYTGVEQDVNLQAMMMMTIRGDKAYIISYTADPASYTRYLPVVKEMINSFEFTNSR